MLCNGLVSQISDQNSWSQFIIGAIIWKIIAFIVIFIIIIIISIFTIIIDLESLPCILLYDKSGLSS